MTTLAELVRRNRMLWGGICWVLTLVLAGFGVPFAVLGVRATPLPSAYAAITGYVPGGMHTYGAIMLVAAAAFLTGLAAYPIARRPMNEPLLHGALWLFVGFAAGIDVAFVASWVLTHTPTWQALIYWSSLGGLAALAGHLTPEREEGERAS